MTLFLNKKSLILKNILLFGRRGYKYILFNYNVFSTFIFWKLNVRILPFMLQKQLLVFKGNQFISLFLKNKSALNRKVGEFVMPCKDVYFRKNKKKFLKKK